MVVDITTKDGGETGHLRVAQRKGGRWGPVRFEKTAPLCGGTSFRTGANRTISAEEVNRIYNLWAGFPAPPESEYF